MNDEQLCIVTIAAVIIVLLGVVGYTIYDEEIKGHLFKDKKSKDTALVAREGDELSVDYIGYFQDGTVFDTSIGDVARNSSVPKALSFASRPTYDDMTFTIGAGTMIEGFENSAIGKMKGQTYTVSIPPEEGYGEANDVLIYRINTTSEIPMTQVIDKDDFISRFPMVDLGNDTRFVHPFWGWSVEIIDVGVDSVTIRNLPTYGQNIKILPWNITVVDISTEKDLIKVHHQVDEISKGMRVDITLLTGLDPEWTKTADQITDNKEPLGFITSTGGVITLDFNKEVAGKTLVFRITINDIRRSE